MFLYCVVLAATWNKSCAIARKHIFLSTIASDQD